TFIESTIKVSSLAQHAKLDTLIVDSMSRNLDATAIDTAINEYLEIGGMVDAGLANQVDFDIDNIARATARAVSAAERDTVVGVQRQGLRWTYLGSGMTPPKFAGSLGEP